MASYTMQLSEYIEQATQEDPRLSMREKIEIGRQKLFDFEYPIFDEKYRHVFETHFIRNFFMREIGFETEGLFKFQLETWLNINMPYFNKLFESELFKYDPLTEVDYHVKYNRVSDKTQNDIVDKTENTTHSSTQNDTSLTTHRESILNVENGTSTNTENNSKNGNSNESLDGNVNENGTLTSNVDTDSIQNTSSNGTSKDKTKTETNVESNGKSNVDVGKFERDIKTDTPDSRLQISTEDDGKGVINYASSIEEQTNKDKTTTTSEEKSKTTGTSETNGETENESETTTKSNSQQNDNTTKSTSTNNDTNKSFSESENINQNGTSTNRHQGDVDKTIRGESQSDINGDGSLLGNQKLDSKINNVEEYMEHRFGKVSSTSYAKIITEYRNALLRIEKDIFWEMNELFMLVY